MTTTAGDHAAVIDKMVEYLVEHDRHAANAALLIREANHPCDGEHVCEEEHDTDPCDCDLACECLDPDTARAQANTYALLAQGAALCANTYALRIAQTRNS